MQINQTDLKTSRSASQTDQTTTQTNQTASQLPVQGISVSLPQTQTIDNGVQAATQDTQGQIVQLDALQQAQTPVSDGETQAQIQDSTNTGQATEPTTQQMPKSLLTRGTNSSTGAGANTANTCADDFDKYERSGYRRNSAEKC